MFARLWMRRTHKKEVCTCEPLNRVRSRLRIAILWMECTCVNGTGETYKCVRICKTRTHLWMEMRICDGELSVENWATYLLTGHLRCKWDLIPMNGTTHVWTGPLLDYQFTNGGPIPTWRSSHTRRYRLHVEDHGRTANTQLVNGISTCERVFHVWTGYVYVNGSCTCEGPSTRERDIHVWLERDVYVWMDFGQMS